MSEKATEFLTMLDGYHIYGTAETYHRGNKMRANANHFRCNGWVPLNAPAEQSDRGTNHTSGGVSFLHKSCLRVASPTIATGKRGDTMPESHRNPYGCKA